MKKLALVFLVLSICLFTCSCNKDKNHNSDAKKSQKDSDTLVVTCPNEVSSDELDVTDNLDSGSDAIGDWDTFVDDFGDEPSSETTGNSSVSNPPKSNDNKNQTKNSDKSPNKSSDKPSNGSDTSAAVTTEAYPGTPGYTGDAIELPLDFFNDDDFN